MVRLMNMGGPSYAAASQRGQALHDQRLARRNAMFSGIGETIAGAIDAYRKRQERQAEIADIEATLRDPDHRPTTPGGAEAFARSQLAALERQAMADRDAAAEAGRMERARMSDALARDRMEAALNKPTGSVGQAIAAGAPLMPGRRARSVEDAIGALVGPAVGIKTKPVSEKERLSNEMAREKLRRYKGENPLWTRAVDRASREIEDEFDVPEGVSIEDARLQRAQELYDLYLKNPGLAGEEPRGEGDALDAEWERMTGG